MKIAITGHTAGIGQALATSFQERGHDIVGLSKRHGHNIRNIIKTADLVEPCDMFVNNAQSGYAQTELLFELVRRWQGTGKHIVVISTMMTHWPVSTVPGLTEYWCQKTALEMAVTQLRYQLSDLKITVVRPGNIATSPDKTVPPAADVTNWCTTLIDIFELARQRNLSVPDISLGPIH